MQKKFFFAILIFFLSASLLSHQRSESYSKVNIENEENHKKATIEFSIQTSVLQRLNLNFTQDWEKEFTEEVINNFKLSHNCQIRKTPFLKIWWIRVLRYGVVADEIFLIDMLNESAVPSTSEKHLEKKFGISHINILPILLRLIFS